MDKPLRILCIVNLPWDARLGAVRVWFELSEQWKKAGHKIDTANSWRKVSDIEIQSPTKALMKFSSPAPTAQQWFAFLGSYIVPNFPAEVRERVVSLEDVAVLHQNALLCRVASTHPTSTTARTT